MNDVKQTFLLFNELKTVQPKKIYKKIGDIYTESYW